MTPRNHVVAAACAAVVGCALPLAGSARIN